MLNRDWDRHCLKGAKKNFHIIINHINQIIIFMIYWGDTNSGSFDNEIGNIDIETRSIYAGSNLWLFYSPIVDPEGVQVVGIPLLFEQLSFSCVKLLKQIAINVLAPLFSENIGWQQSFSKCPDPTLLSIHHTIRYFFKQKFTWSWKYEQFGIQFRWNHKQILVYGETIYLSKIVFALRTCKRNSFLHQTKGLVMNIDIKDH